MVVLVNIQVVLVHQFGYINYFFLLILICSLCWQQRQPSSAGAALLAPWRWLSTSLIHTYTYIHTYHTLHTYIHYITLRYITLHYIHTYTHACHTYIHACMHACIHTYITYIHYIHTYIYRFSLPLQQLA